MKKGRVVAVVVVCAVIGFFVDRKFFADPWTASECDTLEKVSSASPEGLRLAKHVFFACGAGLTEQVWDAVVVVQRGQNPVKGDEVWTGSVYSHDKIGLSWQAADRLQITLPNESLTYKQKASRDGLVIEYRFDPDDPFARQEFLAKQDRH
jgi:hypothetical protein